MTREQDARWLDALAGRGPADDADTRQAAQLRGFYIEQARAQAEEADPEFEIRQLAWLQRRLEDTPAVARAPAKRSAGWLERLFPPGRGRAGRYSLLVAAVVAIAVVPGLLRRPFPAGDSEIKALPPSIKLDTSRVHEPASSPAATAPADNAVSSADPVRDAAELQRLLTAAGATAVVDEDGADRLVQADLTPDRVAALKSELAPRGITVPDDGHLRVRLHKKP